MVSCLCQALSTRTRSDPKWSIATISGLELPNPHFPFVTDFKSLYGLVGDELFSTLQPPLPHRQNASNLLLLFCYFPGRYFGELHSLFPPAQILTSRTFHAMYIIISFTFHSHVLSQKCCKVEQTPKGVLLWSLQSLPLQVNNYLSSYVHLASYVSLIQ